MSSSPSPSRADLPSSTREPVWCVQPFPYDLVPQRPLVPACDGLEGDQGRGEVIAEEQARRAARQEALAEARKTFEEQLARERDGVAAALGQFTRDRAAYFQKVEGEVVQLALSIARKILHRESQLDPLLLAGTVRVALEKIDGATGVVLRLHPQNVADWRRYLTTQMEPSDLPEFVEDAAQALDRCTIETSMGTALVGLDVQLKEIEQGLMDLLAARPGALR
ncbi:MAG TPA: FliH/SctL family protein [Silvibacterium sp.]|nr:FliH/SctL family protein [Silvibacterium sp.]